MNDVKISIAQVVASAKMQLRIQGTSDDTYLRMLAMEGEKEIATKQTLIKKTASLDISSFKSTLPTGVYEINWIRYENGENDYVYPHYTDNPFFDVHTQEDITLSAQYSIDINGGYVYHSTDIPFTTCRISYIGLDLDDYNEVRIPESHERALRNYLCYQYTLAESDKYSQYIIDTYRKDWISNYNKVRGRDAKPGMQELRRLSLMWNSLLPGRHSLHRYDIKPT